MIYLTGTSDLIRVITGSGGTIDVHASWVDLNGSTVTPGRTNTAITTATTTTVVGSPAGSTYRSVKNLYIENKHATSSNSITVFHTDGSTTVNLFTINLLAGWHLHYDEATGWRLFDTNGGAVVNSYTSPTNISNALLTATQKINLQKSGSAPKAAGAFQSMWLANPSPGVASPAYTAGSGYTCSRTTTGALTYTNASAGTNRLAGIEVTMSVIGSVMLVDRLWSCSGFIGSSITTHVITTPGSLPARITDNGLGLEAYIENFIAAGAATGTATLNYTNASGTASSAIIPAVVSAPVAGQMQRFPISNGIQAPVSVTNSATWTSGTFGLTIVKPIITIGCPLANTTYRFDWQGTALEKILNDACLMVIQQATATTATNIFGYASIIDL